MKLNVAVQMDPIARINTRGDSTFALLLEAQKRGHGLSYYTPDKLSLRGEELVAPVQVLTVRDEAGDHFTLGEPRRRFSDGQGLSHIGKAFSHALWRDRHRGAAAQPGGIHRGQGPRQPR